MSKTIQFKPAFVKAFALLQSQKLASNPPPVPFSRSKMKTSVKTEAHEHKAKDEEAKCKGGCKRETLALDNGAPEDHANFEMDVDNLWEEVGMTDGNS